MRFIVRRLGFYAVAAWVAVTVNFFIPRAMPGNAVDTMMAKYPNLLPAAQKALDVEFGVGHQGSLMHQYWVYLGDLFHGNLGLSVNLYPATVTSILAQTIPWTLVLIGTATLIAFALGTLLGILAAWRRGGWLDSGLPAFTFLQAMPYFFLALLAIQLFSLHWRVFPIGQGYTLGLLPGWNWPFIESATYHSILPALTIIVTSMAGWMLQMRNVMITTLGEDYVLAAQAKGLSSRRVMMTYAARNAILPNIAGFALAIGFVVAGALVMEIVFSYPGVGLTLYNAVTSDDYPLTQGIFLVISFAVLGACLVADTVYVLADPRARTRAARDDGRASARSGDPALQASRPSPLAPAQGEDRRRHPRGLRADRDHRPDDRALRPVGDDAQVVALPPSLHHLLGTTASGQDVLSQLLVGSRSTVVLALMTGVIATVLAVLFGVTAGFVGGATDDVLSLVINVFLVLPALPLLIVLLGYLPPSAGELPIAIVLSGLGWPWGARVLRAQTLTLRKRDYVLAARESGERTWRILLFEILPNEVSLIAASFVGVVLYAILTSVTLAFIGVSSFSGWSLGTMLYWAEGQSAIQIGAWWWYAPPGLTAALLGMSLVLLNFGLDELGNPRLRDTGRRRLARPRLARDGSDPGRARGTA